MEEGENAFHIERSHPNNLLLEVVTSRSFKRHDVAEEITYRIQPRNVNAAETLSSLSGDLYRIFETVLQDARERYGANSMMRIFIKHPNLEGVMIIKPDYINNFLAMIIETHLKYKEVRTILKLDLIL